MAGELPDDVAVAVGDLLEASFSTLGVQMESVVQFYADYSVGSVESAGSLVSQFSEAYKALDESMDSDLEFVNDGVESWSGIAAGGFEEYMGKVRESLHVHLQAMEAMACVAAGYGEMLIWIRARLVEIASETAKALSELKTAEEIIFDVVTAVASFATGMGAMKVAKSTIDWVAGALSVNDAASKVVGVVGGLDAITIMENYDAAINSLRDAVEEQLGNFKNAIAEIAATLDPDRLPDVQFIQQGNLDIVEANTSFDPGEFRPVVDADLEGVGVVDGSPLLDDSRVEPGQPDPGESYFGDVSKPSD